MTLPSERYNAVRQTRDFLRQLLDLKVTPRVPKNIRNQARALLKHYPGDMYLKDIFNDDHKKQADWEKNTLTSFQRIKYGTR
jgi:hypothetical protein